MVVGPAMDAAEDAAVDAAEDAAVEVAAAAVVVVMGTCGTGSINVVLLCG